MTRDPAETIRPWPALILGLAVLTGCGSAVDLGQVSMTDPDMSSGDMGDATHASGPTSTGASTTGAMSTPVLVKLTETDVTLAPGTWHIFAATVENATFPYVTWSLDPPANSGVFHVQSAPLTVRYDAPATPGTYRLIAASDEDPTVSAVVTITVSASAPTKAVIFDNYNAYGVMSDPAEDTTFDVAEARHVTSINTYHYLIGDEPGGTIALRHSDSTLYGPWPVLELDSAGKLRTEWYCYPNVDIKPGTYTVVDSSPATWSMNEGSGYLGFAHVEGLAMP